MFDEEKEDFNVISNYFNWCKRFTKFSVDGSAYGIKIDVEKLENDDVRIDEDLEDEGENEDGEKHLEEGVVPAQPQSFAMAHVLDGDLLEAWVETCVARLHERRETPRRHALRHGIRPADLDRGQIRRQTRSGGQERDREQRGSHS